jgi:MraZ protein
MRGYIDFYQWERVGHRGEGIEMLISSHVVSVDAKGRVSIPARFREFLNATYGDQIILLDKDGCIFAYPLEEWKRHREDVRRYLRQMYGRATPCEIDRQGRILLPSRIRVAAGIEKEAVIVGLENKFEIWGRERWDETVQEPPVAGFEGLEPPPDEGLIQLEF